MQMKNEFHISNIQQTVEFYKKSKYFQIVNLLLYLFDKEVLINCVFFVSLDLHSALL